MLTGSEYSEPDSATNLSNTDEAHPTASLSAQAAASVNSEPRRQTGDENQRKKETEKEHDRNAARAAIYAMYNEATAAEDVVLITRWTETLNILLTFAGLQSAIVTAFIIAVDQDLRPGNNGPVVTVMQQILYRMDNTTTLPSEAPWTPPEAAVVTSAWWYSSLACSLISAFGALLGKQWVLHYQSQLPWATTAEEKAQLREARYQGIATWRFFGVIESLPILLQLSLLCFAIGLTGYLHPISLPLLYLVLAFIALGATFYLLTLMCGTVFPSCPFKSPITALLYRAAYKMLVFLARVYITILAAVAIVYGLLTSKRNLVRKKISAVRSLWWEYSTLHLSYWHEKDHSEAVSVGESSTGAGGVLCWWLYQGTKNAGHESQLNVDAAIDAILSFPPKVILGHFQTRDVFESWCRRVVSDLHDPRHRRVPGEVAHQRPSTLQEVDALCHFMYGSPTAKRIAINSVSYDETEKRSRFCRAIRNAFPSPNTSGQLPIATMRWPTVAIYLRAQLHDWCTSKLPPNEWQHRDLVMQELPILLADPGLMQYRQLWDLANIASLAAVALVREEVPGVCNKTRLISSDPLDQLILALHRLSHYDLHSHRNTSLAQTTEKLFSLIMLASRKVLVNWGLGPTGPSALLRCPVWKDGTLGNTLLRLLRLGISYRDYGRSNIEDDVHGEDQQTVMDVKGAFVQQLQGLMVVVFHQASSLPQVELSGLAPLSSISALSSALKGYAPSPVVSTPNISSIKSLNYVFGLRYYEMENLSCLYPSCRLASWKPLNTLPLSILQDNPRVLPQLISDLGTLLAPDFNTGSHLRPTLLALVVKGRDLFFPFDLLHRSIRHRRLVRELDSLAGRMFESGSFLSSNDTVLAHLKSFEDWAGLLQALQELQDLLVTNRGTEGAGKRLEMALQPSIMISGTLTGPSGVLNQTPLTPPTVSTRYVVHARTPVM